VTTWRTRSGQVVRRVMGGRSAVFLLSNGERHLLVDTGRANRWTTLSRRLRELGVSRIQSLVLTHTHFDHAENAQRVRDSYGAAVFVHESEAPFLRCGDSPLPRGTVMPTRLLLRLLGRQVQARVRYGGCEADVLVGDRLDLGSRGLGACLLHTPGHSRGSTSLVVDGEVAIVGDALFGLLPWSVFPPFGDDVPRLVESWRRLLDSGCRIYLPAHGSAVDRRRVARCYVRHARQVADSTI